MPAVSSNRQIATNTIFLYIRMIILLVLGLYISRITLIALGVSDYGIYNVVGGIVTMFVFINNAMVNSTQRYVTYELGTGKREKLELVFSTSINIHAAIALIILLMAETIGLWFLYHKMVIPLDRMDAAFWIYQFSIVTCMLSVMTAPFNALIIAHEKMAMFAYLSLLDSGFKLLAVLYLKNTSGDRLIMYGVSLMFIAVMDLFIYIIYCRNKFQESKYRCVFDKPLISEMTKFASWNIIGNLSYVCYTQGLNILLNMFFNPVVNAARGVAVQVQSVIANFSYNIENAIKPQITKTYAIGEISRMFQLMYASARFSFLSLLVLSLPVFIEAEQMLGLWLAEVPDHTANFVRLTILILLADVLTGPLLTAAQSTGDIKKYQLTVSLLGMMILPLSYFALKIVTIPEIVFIVNLIIIIIIQYVKLKVVCKQIHMPISEYLKKVFVRAFAVAVLSSIVSVPIFFMMSATLLRLFFVLVISLLSVTIFGYTIGLTSNEREMIRTKVLSLLFRFRNHI